MATGFRECLESVPDWAPTLRLCDPVAVYRSAVGLVAGTRPTMRDMLTALTIKRTFVRADRGEPLADAEKLSAAGVDVVTIADAGHVMMVDQPEATIELADGRRVPVRAESLEGHDLEGAWARIANEAPEYAKYRTKTDREIPVLRLRQR
ncbi:MAG: DUF385 domain-containing protein [Chloroflexi bacterium]|nr:MAG: DUF385 domain-containing protein [Chloroflexota bacterium]